MRRDPKAFRERFAAWKNGEQVYDNGRPIELSEYSGGKDSISTFVSQLGPLLYKKLQKRNIDDIDSVYSNMISQLAYESNYGTSRVAREQHNYGGYGWNGKTYTTFKDDADFIDHYLNIMTGRHKQSLKAKDPSQFAESLKKSGYYEDTVDNYRRNLQGMVTLRRIANQHRRDNIDLYTSNPIKQEEPIQPSTEAIHNSIQSQQIPRVDPIITPQSSTRVDQPWRYVEAQKQVDNSAGWKAMNHFQTLDLLKQVMDGYDWQLPKLPPLFPLNVNQWTKSLIGYKCGKDSLPGYATGEDGGFLNWLKNAVIGVSVADAPAVATASGWHNEDGQWRQNRTAADEQLGQNLSVLSTFSPTHPLTAATEKALQVAGRTLKMLRGPFVADVMDIETPIAPNVGQQIKDLSKDYTLAGGNERFNRILYDNYLHGYDVPGLLRTQPKVTSVPNEFVKIYKNSITPRLALQRPWMNAEDIQYGVDNALKEGYRVYDDAIFKRAGHPDAEAGFYNKTTGRISIKNGYEDFAIGHELRHRVDDMRVPLVESEENLLNASFTDDFKSQGLNMSEEMVTTNFDGRKKLLGKDVLKRVPISKQNEMIDEATYEEMVKSMEGANRYGKRYVEALINKYGRVPDELIKAWKESYKHVGMFTGAAAVSKTKKKQQK